MTTTISEENKLDLKKRYTLRPSFWRTTVLKIFQRKSAQIGLGVVLGVFVFVIVASHLDQFSPSDVSGPANTPPSFAHPFGTDFLGHDLLSQVAWGAYPSLFVGLVAAVLSVTLGFMVGIIGGYYRRLEPVLAAATDITLSFPSLVLLVLIGSLFLATNTLIIESLVLVLWAVPARAVRAQVLAVKQLPYVEAARVSGLKDWEIIWRIIAPEIGAIAIAYLVFNVSIAIVLVTALEFLGIGNPNIISWGSILFFAQQYGFYLGDWWWVLAPGLTITLIATGFALVGFSVEEIMNPRLRV